MTDHDSVAVSELLESLAARRRRDNLTVTEVARRMGTTRAVVTRVEERDAVGGGLQMATVMRYARAVGARLGLMAVLPSEVLLFGAVEQGVGQAGPEHRVTRHRELDAGAAGH